MKFFNLFICFALLIFQIPFPLMEQETSRHQVDQYTFLTLEQMDHLVGGSSVGQIEISRPYDSTDVSGDGSVYYNVSYDDVAGSVDFVLFVVNSSSSTIELDRDSSVSGSGTETGYFSSSDVNTTLGMGVLVAELVDPDGDAYDPCADGSETVYARSTIYIEGDGT